MIACLNMICKPVLLHGMEKFLEIAHAVEDDECSALHHDRIYFREGTNMIERSADDEDCLTSVAMGFNKVLQLHLPDRGSHSLDLHNLPIYLPTEIDRTYH